jgi:hypothetical protein
MNEIYKKALSNGGLTFSLIKNKCVSKGFAVSFSKKFEKIINVADFTARDITTFISNLGGLPKEACLGVWINKDLVYLDVSVVYNDSEKALRRARDLGEIAIYDLSKKSELFIDRV